MSDQPEPMFSAAPQADGSLHVTIPPQNMQGMSPLAWVGIVSAIIKAAPAIMALLPEIKAVVDQIMAQLPQQPTGGAPPP